MRLAIVAYLIPFVFAFNSALLLEGTWLEIIVSCLSVVAGHCAFGAARRRRGQSECASEHG